MTDKITLQEGVKWIKSVFSKGPAILEDSFILKQSTSDLLVLLHSGTLSMQTGSRVVTEILARFHQKIGE